MLRKSSWSLSGFWSGFPDKKYPEQSLCCQKSRCGQVSWSVHSSPKELSNSKGSGWVSLWLCRRGCDSSHLCWLLWGTENGNLASRIHEFWDTLYQTLAMAVVLWQEGHKVCLQGRTTCPCSAFTTPLRVSSALPVPHSPWHPESENSLRKVFQPEMLCVELIRPKWWVFVTKSEVS